MESCGETHSGIVRNVNQDIYKIHFSKAKDVAVLVVCDGMGGANAGNVASKLAADVFTDYLGKNLPKTDKSTKLDYLADIVTDAVVAANKAVYDKGIEDEQCYGMGTTLVALVSSEAGEIVVNIGDSRAYHITPRGILQITKDHSVVEDMIDRGEITRKEADSHPRKNLITKAIGAEDDVQPDIFTQNIDSNDIVLLCSDGLSNVIVENEIFEELINSSSLHEACNALIDKALSRGAPDNVTVAVFRK